MNYFKIYKQLIVKSQNRILEGYSENHHIIPRCLGGTNKQTNLVLLTPEEHYLAHQLLVKIYPDELKLVFAAFKMTQGRPGNKLYGWLRKKHSEAISKQQMGSGNSQFGTMWITNGTDNKKIKKDVDLIPEGWYNGRVIPSMKGRKTNVGYKHNDEIRQKISKALKGKSKPYRERLKDRKSFKIIDPYGNIVEGKGVKPFCIEHGLNPGNISQLIIGKRKSCQGWKYAG